MRRFCGFRKRPNWIFNVIHPREVLKRHCTHRIRIKDLKRDGGRGKSVEDKVRRDKGEKVKDR